MTDVATGYERLSDLNVFVCEFSSIIACLKLQQTFTNFVLKQKYEIGQLSFSMDNL